MSSEAMRLSSSLPCMSGSFRSVIMQSKMRLRSSSSASSPEATSTISMSSSPISWITLRRCRSSSSTSSTVLTFCVSFSSSRANTRVSSSRVAGLRA